MHLHLHRTLRLGPLALALHAHAAPILPLITIDPVASDHDTLVFDARWGSHGQQTVVQTSKQLVVNIPEGIEWTASLYHNFFYDIDTGPGPDSYPNGGLIVFGVGRGPAASTEFMLASMPFQADLNTLLGPLQSYPDAPSFCVWQHQMHWHTH
ncbi:MAG: hypothetical protein ACKVYV_08660 [Limisphaerales bacterium]